jgi:hypothetical protein
MWRSCFKIASTTITIPKITGTTATIDVDQELSLQATASDGAINWYANASGGTSLATTNSFTTPILPTTTSYYVDTMEIAQLPRIVIATIKPSLQLQHLGSVCISGTATLGSSLRRNNQQLV